MPCSLEKRFNNCVPGGARVVVDYAWNYGEQKAMTKFGVKDYIAWRRFLDEAPTGGKGCGYVSKMETPFIPSVISKAESMEARTIKRLGELEVKIIQLQVELDAKNALIEQYRSQSGIKIADDVMAVCEL